MKWGGVEGGPNGFMRFSRICWMFGCQKMRERSTGRVESASALACSTFSPQFESVAALRRCHVAVDAALRANHTVPLQFLGGKRLDSFWVLVWVPVIGGRAV